MFKVIRKRDGREVSFDEAKITDAIFKAARAVGGEDRQTAMELTIEVLKMLKTLPLGLLMSMNGRMQTVLWPIVSIYTRF